MAALAHSKIVVECIKDPSRWHDLRDEFDQIASDNFMQQYAWLRAWWDTYGHHQQSLFILRASCRNKSIAFLPLYLKCSPLSGTVIRGLGDGKACSDNVGLQACEGFEQAASQAICKYLLHSSVRSHWDFIEIDGVRELNAPTAVFASTYEDLSGNEIQKTSGPSSWCIDVSEGWDCYLASHSKRTRRLLRRSINNYFDSGTAQFETLSEPNQVADFLNETAFFHQQRWKNVGHDGCFNSRGFTRFLSQTTTNFFQLNRLFCARLSIGGEFGAGVIGFLNGDRVSLYLIGMNCGLAKHRPGLLLNLGIIRYAMQHELHNVDFLRGDEEYKWRLGAKRARQFTLRAPAPHALAKFRNQACQAGSKFKSWIKEHFFSDNVAPPKTN